MGPSKIGGDAFSPPPPPLSKPPGGGYCTCQSPKGGLDKGEGGVGVHRRLCAMMCVHGIMGHFRGMRKSVAQFPIRKLGSWLSIILIFPHTSCRDWERGAVCCLAFSYSAGYTVRCIKIAPPYASYCVSNAHILWYYWGCILWWGANRTSSSYGLGGHEM